MAVKTVLNSIFTFAPLFFQLLGSFGGSNIVVAVFNIAVLIRKFYQDGKHIGLENYDELAVSLIDEVPDIIKKRYGLDYVKPAIVKLAEGMELLHQGREAIKTRVV